MRKKYYVIAASAILIVVLALMLLPGKSEPTITYFPPDPEEQFKNATNTLQLHQTDKENAYSVSWENYSETEAPLFLRQDVSVLYRDGRLIGVKSIWKENAQIIDFTESFQFKKDHLFQAVTLHYGETHKPNDVINSLWEMSYSELYVKGEKNDGTIYFQQPQTEQDSESQTDLQKKTKENLLHHWHRLTSHFDIDLSQYDVVPLTELHQFEKKALQSFTQEQTDEIIGKLWEGLYKNYVIPVSKEKEVSSDSYVPLILFGKHEHDILVLFELNGEKIKLKQVYPSF